MVLQAWGCSFWGGYRVRGRRACAPAWHVEGHQDVIQMGIAKYNEECRGIAAASDGYW